MEDERETIRDDRLDVLGDAFFEARRAELAERVGEHRFAHSEGVAETAQFIAEVYGVDVRKARLAGILHDWDKGLDDPGIRQRVHDLGMDIPETIVEGFPQTLHEKTAACALSREFPQIPADVIRAISRHTTAAVDMQPLDMVLYIADGLEPGRRFAEADVLRAMIGTVPLEDLFVEVYGFWMAMIIRRRKTMHPDTVTVWNAYAMRQRERRVPGG